MFVDGYDAKTKTVYGFHGSLAEIKNAEKERRPKAVPVTINFDTTKTT